MIVLRKSYTIQICIDYFFIKLKIYPVSNKRDKKNIKVFGKRVQELRLAANISQAQLAFECEMDVTQIARIERGEITQALPMFSELPKH